MGFEKYHRSIFAGSIILGLLSLYFVRWKPAIRGKSVMAIINRHFGHELFSSTPDPADFQQNILQQTNSAESLCKIPKPNPWHPSIRKFFGTKNITCTDVQEKCTSLDNDGWLKITCPNVSCRYHCFDRKPGFDGLANFYYSNWTRFYDKVQPGCEFIEVKCADKTSGHYFYKKLYSQIIPKPGASNSQKPSVVMLVLDSVSHSSFRRDLPKSHQVLQTVLGAKILDGYVKTGSGSFSNAATFLTGKYYHDPDLRYNKTMTFDEWPLIWKNFSDRGYVTYYSEDYPRWHLFSHLTLKGFRHKPVDHYARPFFIKVIHHKMKRGFCFGNELMLATGLRYLKQFIVKYGPNRPKFALHWIVDAAHRDPTFLSAHDEVLAEFLQSLKPIMENTILFVMADHGHRFVAIRSTAIGRVEDRMPFFSATLPENFPDRDRISDALEANSDVLTSHFDLYITLCDILLSADDKHVRRSANEKLWQSLRPRGLSLFRRIPPRDCETAGIIESNCICQQPVPVNITHPRVKLGATKVVDHINNLLVNQSASKCAHLGLRRILYASVVHPNVKIDKLSNDSNETENLHFLLTVGLVVDPSGGMFEGTLKYLEDSEYYLENLAVTGNVDRINRYGNQSYCVDSMILRPYCYCM